MLLTVAYRSLSRLSSALSAKASTLCSFLLDLTAFPAGTGTHFLTHSVVCSGLLYFLICFLVLDIFLDSNCSEPFRFFQLRHPAIKRLLRRQAGCHFRIFSVVRPQQQVLRAVPNSYLDISFCIQFSMYFISSGSNSRFNPLDKWRLRDSNSRPPACKAGALPTELHPRKLSDAKI